MHMTRTKGLAILSLAAILSACGPGEKPVTIEGGIEEAAKATQGGVELRKNQPKKPPVEPKRTGVDARFPGPD